MNALTKWRPFRKSGEVYAWRPFTHWDPFRDMEDMMRGMQRAFAQWPRREEEETLTLADWAPSVDIAENDKEYLVKAELPDVKKEDIKVSVEKGTLSITGERKSEKEEKGLKFHRVERSYGRFERSFTLPDETEAGKITSEYKDGILTVHLPKNLSAKPEARQVAVQ